MCSEITSVVCKFCLCLSVFMSVMLLVCSVPIYRLSGLIAANLFKKKQFLIKTVNIGCVDFRFVKKHSVLRVFIL